MTSGTIGYGPSSYRQWAMNSQDLVVFPIETLIEQHETESKWIISGLGRTVQNEYLL